MKAVDLAYETGSAILANRARSLLTILGIVIGIAAVIAMTSLIDGVRLAMAAQIGLNASRSIQITFFHPGGTYLTEDEISSAERDMASEYEFITASYYTMTNARSQDESTDSMQVTACDEKYFEAMGTKAEKGRLFTSEENEKSSMVCVLNTGAVKKLFGSAGADVVGKTVSIGSDTYTVVGTVYTDQTYGDYQYAYLPLKTAKARMGDQLSTMGGCMVTGFTKEGVDPYQVATHTASYLSNRYGVPANPDTPDTETGFAEATASQSMLDQAEKQMASFQIMTVSIAAISLLVGGIGIMNMMLTNVTERIREIGLRKALGAKRADITAQFLMESIVICVVGGALGIAVGLAGAFALAGVAGQAMSVENLTPVITPRTAIMAAGICCFIGVLFGYYPARRASRLDPVVALRFQ